MALKSKDRQMIKEYKEQGWSQRQVTRELGVSRTTVRRYWAQPERGGYHRQQPYPSCLALYQAYLVQRLRDYPTLSAEKLYREIQGRGFAGKYRVVAYYVRQHRPVQAGQVFLRYETDPGEQAQVDWAEFGTINYYGRTCKLHCFSLVLGYSRRHYIEYTVSEDLPTLMRCHQRAFAYFGGVPKKILYDNQAQVVKVNTGTQVEFNEKFLDFAGVYGFTPKACGVDQPQQKGKVERVIEYIRSSFFTGEQFSSLDELNSRALAWCQTLADQRVHGTTHERPLDRWAAEQAALLPLPATKYDTRQVERRQVQKDCYLNYAGNCYSVPWQYARKTVTVKAGELTLTIYANDQAIAEHPLCLQKGKYIRNPDHLKGIPLVKDSRQEKYRAALAELGEVGLQYFNAVLNSGIANPYYHLNCIMKLKQHYAVREITGALEIALRFKALLSKTIVNLVRRQIPAYQDDGQPLRHSRLAQILALPGLNYNGQEVEQRPLELYEWLTKESGNG